MLNQHMNQCESRKKAFSDTYDLKKKSDLSAHFLKSYWRYSSIKVKTSSKSEKYQKTGDPKNTQSKGTSTLMIVRYPRIPTAHWALRASTYLWKRHTEGRAFRFYILFM